ncbi:BamA/TamA family outer membrane protein [Scytonema sp. NUACC26]|uniref:BamA/TamA family outer membrane protein n=1 Tax=Scytonema sp. NUACC26 TaxID=3140176 RepID=UPI0034DB9847
MRVSSAAIFTLATLTASNVTQQAIAAPSNVPTQGENVNNIVIPTEGQQRLGNSGPPLGIRGNGDLEVETENMVEFSPSSSTSPNNQSPSPQAPVASPQSPNRQSPVASPQSSSPSNDLVVTAIDVKIEGATEELEQIIRSKIKTQAGGETSESQLQQDVAAILDTGLFVNARVDSNTTSTGLNVVYQVQPVTVRSIQLSGAKALTYQVAWERFQSQVGTAISPNGLKAVVEQINKWYADNGYKIARVISITPTQDGILTVNVGEGVIGSVQIRYVNDEGKTVDDKGNPVRGRTKQDFLRQQLKLKSGQLFQESVVKQDLQQLYKTGLFENVNVALEGDATKLDVIYQLKEAGARSVNVGGNYSADQGIVGTFTYNDRNVGGGNDTLGVNVQVGRRDIQFESKFSSPYRASNPDRLGYSITTFRKRGLSDTFDGDVKLADGDRIREGKIGGSISFQRPIDDWDTSLGFNYTRVSIRDREGTIVPFDEQGNQLSFSGSGIDDLATVSFTATKDFRDNPSNPTSGSILKLSTEQSVPIGNGQISMNRIKANYTQFQPVKLFESKKPQVFALNLQAGTVLGDLPPYETFNLGGPNSVRGYDGGDVASGRTYVLASAEYRFPIPILDALGGIVFADFASDLGSGDSVLDNPGGVRGKPGTGFGYGAGLRFDSPLGLIRADFGLNDQGESRLQFGIGQRF